MTPRKEKQNCLLHCEIENSYKENVSCKFMTNDSIIYADTLSLGKTSFELEWMLKDTSSISAYFNDQYIDFQQIAISDSIGYLMIQLKESIDEKLNIEGNFFEN